MPLVCSRFRRLLQQPGSWQEVSFTERRMAALAEELRMRLFLSWAHRISQGLRRLKIDIPADLDDDGNAVLLSDLSSVLGQAAPSLQLLELKCRYSLDARRLLPQLLQSQLRALTELHLLAEDRIEGLQLARLTALQRLNIVVDGDPPESFEPDSTLPPSITWLGLTPTPIVPEPGLVGVFSKAIPACVCALPQLRFLDISESRGLSGLQTALRHLTLLTGLALDHAGLPDLPEEMTGLQHLRLLSLHGTFSWDDVDDEMQQPINLTALSPLKHLRVLSISESFRLITLPPAVVGLTRLKALHLEKCPALEGLPANLLLPHLAMLSIDWHVLFLSHAVVARQPKLQQLLLGSMHCALDQAFVPARRTQEELAAVEASLQRCTALTTLSVIVYAGPDSGLTMDCASLMLRLPRSCPNLQLQPLDAFSFFLTDSEQLAEGD
ncbi:hypothetical protein COHA_010355 [Chlorella ohadii]|uniref:R13L1/DRL21-like LRR repeat region domain-containing protein n=1 Tax=Chlorella ohadii TaxID=2649997 RepID=A0AAD5DD13_9CHLO|nr:hypothetical protein COHA_010355 [Chlorella ohadii]